MIGKLSGTIDSISQDHVIIDIHGVGYLVYCSTKNLSRFNIGEHKILYIETHVREDHIHLYGFTSELEKSYFNLLTTVNGIGNKVSLAILSYFELNQLHQAILMSDYDAFKPVAGVGKKTAERIIIELKDKLKNLEISSHHNFETPAQFEDNDLITNDALSALVNLGINKADALTTIKKVRDQNPDINLNDLIRQSLKGIAKT